MKKRRVLYLLLILFVIIPTVLTLGRYVVKKGFNILVEANHFYFNSDKLKADEAEYQVNNWSGVDTFTIQIELNSKKNNLLYSNANVNYTMQVNCANGVTCSIDKNSGTIEAGINTDNVTVSVTPQHAFDDGESVTIEVLATSTSPYHKTLSAKFTIAVGKKGISYEIDDVANRPYLSFVITNALASYKINEAFGTYAVGDEINALTYKNLTTEEQDKCSSAIVTLKSNPSVVVLDLTSEIVNNVLEMKYTEIDGISYVSEIKFKVDANSSNEVRYYKMDVTKNYTYPITNSTSIIDFSVET